MMNEPAGFACLSRIHAGVVYYCALTFPTAGQEFTACSVGCLYVVTGLCYLNTGVLLVPHIRLNRN